MAASVVVNGGRSATRVSEATRERITEVATRLRYRPNAVARGLSRRRMNSIGVVSVIETDDVNLYFLEVLNGIVSVAAQHSQSTTICSINSWHTSEKRILQFCDGRVDGVILLGPGELSPGFFESLRHRTQFFAIHGDTLPKDIDGVDVDDESGAYAVVAHLIELGHRRIAHFCGPSTGVGARRRLAGYRRSLIDARLEVDESLLFPGEYDTESGRARTRQLLSACPGGVLPTAIFCANDGIAAGCLEVLAQNHVRVPEDISVAGFDDFLLARMTLPTLTTVAQPFRRMGEYALERLLLWINQSTEPQVAPQQSEGAELLSQAPQPKPTAHIEIYPCELVVRGSTGCPALRPATLPAG